MEITDPASVPTFSFPFVLDCHQYNALMVAQGEGRSPMTSSDAETDSKPIIIIIIYYWRSLVAAYSALELRLYAKHQIRPDTLLGEATLDLHALLKQHSGKRAYSRPSLSLLFIWPILVSAMLAFQFPIVSSWCGS